LPPPVHNRTFAGGLFTTDSFPHFGAPFFLSFPHPPNEKRVSTRRCFFLFAGKVGLVRFFFCCLWRAASALLLRDLCEVGLPFFFSAFVQKFFFIFSSLMIPRSLLFGWAGGSFVWMKEDRFPWAQILFLLLIFLPFFLFLRGGVTGGRQAFLDRPPVPLRFPGSRFRVLLVGSRFFFSSPP